MESIIIEEIRMYYSFVKLFGNNNEIEITIYQQDALLTFLFDSISYEWNENEIDKVGDPWIVSLLEGELCHATIVLLVLEDGIIQEAVGNIRPNKINIPDKNSFMVFTWIFHDYKRSSVTRFYD